IISGLSIACAPKQPEKRPSAAARPDARRNWLWSSKQDISHGKTGNPFFRRSPQAATRLSVIGTSVVKGPAEVFGLCGESSFPPFKQPSLTNSPGQGTCLYCRFHPNGPAHPCARVRRQPFAGAYDATSGKAPRRQFPIAFPGERVARHHRTSTLTAAPRW